jgi:hypothetical protein
MATMLFMHEARLRRILAQKAEEEVKEVEEIEEVEEEEEAAEGWPTPTGLRRTVR